MSQIKLSPAASGAGVLTIAAPATATDRTLNLPDSDGTVIATAPGTSGNVLTSNGTTWTSAAASGGSPFASDISVNGLTVGRGAGNVSTNTAVGSSALANTTGAYNTAIGYQALVAQTTGTGNVAIYALEYLTTGTDNTGINGGGGWGGVYLTTGSKNTYIGYGAHPSSASVTCELMVSSNTTYASRGKGANTGFINPNSGGVYQGNNSSSWSTTSDQRLKKNIVDNNDGLNKITAIQVRNFEYRLPEEVDSDLESSNAVSIAGIQLGVIAQELQVDLPECVKQESTGVLSVDTDNLTWYLVNAIKQLKAEFDAYKAARP